MKASYIGTLALIAGCMLCEPAMAITNNFIGTWTDNTSSPAPNNLTITQDTIAIGKIAYSISDIQPFGSSGQVFKITGVDHAPNPLECGDSNNKHYLVVNPLPPVMPNIHEPPAIQLMTYKGSKVPDPATLDKDANLCEIRPFSRKN